MPNKNTMIAGTREDRTTVGSGYKHDSMYKLATAFLETANNIITESGVDIFDGGRSLVDRRSLATMKNFFVNESADPNSFDSTEDYNNYLEGMENYFDNDKEALLEFSPIGSFNPVIGISFPMHKNLIMNNVYEAAMEKKIAVQPKFTQTMETRFLVTPDGKEIDVYREQNAMTDAINATVPFVDIKMTLPETGTTNVLTTLEALSQFDAVSIETFVNTVFVEVTYQAGEIKLDGSVAEANAKEDVPINVNMQFKPGYGNYERNFMEPINTKIKISNGANPPVYREIEVDDIIHGAMDKNKFYISSMKGIVKSINLSARRDTSNAMIQTCSVRWNAKTTMVEIAEAVPYNVPISPQEVKDISALYNVNQLTKVMSIIKLVMSNYKDDTIKNFLSDSYDRLDASQKTNGTFSFKPRTGYALDHPRWIQDTFMWGLDSHVTKLLQVLNDPNMTITVMGDPDLVRKITPTEYTYVSPSNIGPVELDFTRTISTSDKRVYQFIGSDKKRWKDDLDIIIKPRNSERMVYCLFDYQTYVSNEIRNIANPALPAVHAFDRFKMHEYQPVQGRVTILDRSGGVNDTIAP